MMTKLRKINEDNFIPILQYCTRPNANINPEATVELEAFISSLSGALFQYGSAEEIHHHITTMKELLDYHIQEKSDADIIERFRNRIVIAESKIPITKDLLEQLKEKVSYLTDQDWQRFINWNKQRRKRKADKFTSSSKRNINVSNEIFIKLEKLKISKGDVTWDELFMILLAQQAGNEHK